MRILLMLLFVTEASAQVTFERLKNAASEPGSWLTYSGNYEVKGRQYVSMPSGSALFTFALPE